VNPRSTSAITAMSVGPRDLIVNPTLDVTAIVGQTE